MKREPVLIILVAIVAVGQFAIGWITTGRPDASLFEAVLTAAGAVAVRFAVFSPKTVDKIREEYHKILMGEGGSTRLTNPTKPQARVPGQRKRSRFRTSGDPH